MYCNKNNAEHDKVVEEGKGGRGRKREGEKTLQRRRKG